ncbi:hypothetical protein HZH66_003073 [Vespula vulgaris]|uniref:Uncharacterized protein n=1 Tax=Vespula vulgaris TaxID=7454 RepID=A0A834KML6_VESVU|nr:hypothetical protein HZH66_003073 [Vespula vulgaris]
MHSSDSISKLSPGELANVAFSCYHEKGNEYELAHNNVTTYRYVTCGEHVDPALCDAVTQIFGFPTEMETEESLEAYTRGVVN